MAFLTLEDLTGSCEVVVFPQVYRRHFSLLDLKVPLLLKGKLNNNGEETKILAEEIQPLENVTCELWLRLSENVISKELEERLISHPGSSPVFLFYPEDRHKVQLEKEVSLSLNLKRSLTSLLGEDNILLRFNQPLKAPVAAARDTSRVKEVPGRYTVAKTVKASQPEQPKINPLPRSGLVKPVTISSGPFDPDTYPVPESLLDL